MASGVFTGTFVGQFTATVSENHQVDEQEESEKSLKRRRQQLTDRLSATGKVYLRLTDEEELLHELLLKMIAGLTCRHQCGKHMVISAERKEKP